MVRVCNLVTKSVLVDPGRIQRSRYGGGKSTLLSLETCATKAHLMSGKRSSWALAFLMMQKRYRDALIAISAHKCRSSPSFVALIDLGPQPLLLTLFCTTNEADLHCHGSYHRV